ncbi:MAG: hypothetical protein IJJ33_13105 [Victivallales bacterium]|nr:hypothetical protein [Victivallales bacterium]
MKGGTLLLLRCWLVFSLAYFPSLLLLWQCLWRALRIVGGVKLSPAGFYGCGLFLNLLACLLAYAATLLAARRQGKSGWRGCLAFAWRFLLFSFLCCVPFSLLLAPCQLPMSSKIRLSSFLAALLGSLLAWWRVLSIPSPGRRENGTKDIAASIALLFVLSSSSTPADSISPWKTLLENQKEISYPKRWDALRSLPLLASPTEEASAIGFLESGQCLPGLSPQEDASLRNDLFNHLFRLQSLRDRLAEVLCRCCADPNIPLLWRAYSLQFMGRCHHEVSSSRREQFVQCLRVAIGGEEETLAGTALIAANAVHEEDGLSREELARMANSLCTNPQMSASVRATALAIGAGTGEKGFGVLARRILQRDEQSAILRIAAIAALGRNAEDLALLRLLSRDTDSRIRRAAHAALQRNFP